MTSADVTLDPAVLTRLRDDAVYLRSVFVSDLTQLTRVHAENLIRSGDIPLETATDITELVTRYGAAVNPDSRERTGIREAKTLDALASSLPAHIVAVRGVSYQYCALCSGAEGVQAFFSAQALGSGIEQALMRSNPRAHMVTFEELTAERVVMKAEAHGYVAMMTPYEAALWMYSLHEGHECMRGRTASLEFVSGETPRFVYMKRYVPSYSSPEMRMSSLLRCPNQPTRHLDMDMFLYDRRGHRVIGVVEHAHMNHSDEPCESAAQSHARCVAEVRSKPTTQTLAAARRLQCYAYRIIDHAKLGTVVDLIGDHGDFSIHGLEGMLAHLSQVSDSLS